MKFLDLVASRRSVREYTTQPIEKEKLEYILECARLAPSAVNFQPWEFIVVQNKEIKQKLYQCYPREWFTKADSYIIACADLSQSWKRAKDGKDHGDIDVSIAVEHICLAATEQGIGSCWVCNFDIDLCRSIFNLSSDTVPIAIIPLGYPAKIQEKVSARKELDNIVKYEL